MRVKTILIIATVLLLAVVLIQKVQRVLFAFLFASYHLSRLIELVAVALAAFALGVLVGRSGKRKRPYDEKSNHFEKRSSNTLSNEDRDYIS